jgi:translocator protein
MKTNLTIQLFPNKVKNMTRSKITLQQIAVILSVIAAITMNILANALPLNGQNTGEISDRFPVLFVPAGYVFAIWGLIYIGWIAYAIYQALPAQAGNPRLRKISWLAVGSAAANIAWLFFWHYNIFVLTVIDMLVLLVTLIMIYLNLEIGKRQVSKGEKWAVHIPFSVYLGWITVATIANVTDVLYYIGWNGAPFSPEIWSVALLAAAVIITSLVLITRRDIAYAGVIVWASIGIAIKQSSAALVPTAAWITAAIVTILIIAVAAKISLRPSILSRKQANI